MLIPDLHNFDKNNDIVKLYFKILSTFNDMGIMTINTYPLLVKEFLNTPKASWVAWDDAHPNTKAHNIIATEIFKFYDHLLRNE